jgi:methyl coenzyme M reductase subunit D
MAENNNLIYKLDQIAGVEIDVLCNSLKAIGDEYQRFTNKQKTLVVKEIRKGSGIVEFTEVAVVATTLLFMENTNTILQFVEYLSAVKDVILKGKDKLPNDMQLVPAAVDNMNSILSPVIIGNNNKINFFVGSQSVMETGQDDYNEIKKRSKQIIKELKPTSNPSFEDCKYHKVLFQWVQTRFDNKKSGNQGIIKTIQDKSVKVIFADDNSDTKKEMTSSIQGVDWQRVKYIVDVEAMTDSNRIVLYKILKNYPNDSIIEENDGLELFNEAQ